MSKFIFPYLKSKIKYLSSIIIFVLIFSMLFYAFSLPFMVMAYGMFLFLVFVAGFICVDFFKEYKKHRALLELMEFTDIADFSAIEPKNIMEEDYLGIIQRLRNEITKMVSDYDIREKEMMDYYTMWVHQIKTPISAMGLMLGNEEINRQEIKSELFRTEQYAEMALVYLRLENIHSDLTFEKINVDIIIRKSIKKYARLFIMKRLSMEFSETNIVELTDEKWLGFVIEQVLSNSIKYTGDGGIIKIYGVENTVVIEDNGIGIHAEDLPRVFEKGFTGYNGRTDKKSSGLGLYLCKKTMTALGHKINIESGKGTKVTLYLEREKINTKD